MARIAVGLTICVELGEQRLLDGEVLDDALDDEVAVGEVGRGGRSAVTRPSDRVALVAVELALGRPAVEVGGRRRRRTASAPRRVRERTTTSKPAWAATSARPEPMIPEPTMPTVLISPMRQSLVTRR